MAALRVDARVLVTLALLGPGLARAQNVETARTIGLGGPQRGLVSATDAIASNPAGLGMSNLYVFEASYLDDFAGTDRRVNAAVSDNFDKPLAGGFGYTYRLSGPEALRSTVHRFDLALAGRLSDFVTLGLNGHYITVAARQPDGTEVAASSFSLFSFDAGIQVRTAGGFGVGLVGQNLTDTGQATVPLRVGGGVGIFQDLFSLGVDVMHNTRTARPELAGSGSVLLGGRFALRAGGGYDFGTKGGQISGGAGYVDPRGAIDFGFRQRLGDGAAPGLDGERIFVVTLRFVPKP